MDFIRALEEKDENYYRIARIRCEDWAQEVLRRVEESDRKCHELCKKAISDKIEELTRKKVKALEDLTREARNLEKMDELIVRDRPDIDRVTLELSTEFLIEVQVEQIAKREIEITKLRKRLEDFEENSKRALGENTRIFAETLRGDNEKILMDIRASDEKFRNVLLSKLLCPTQPLSEALRDALVHNRDVTRDLRIKNRITDWSIPESNDNDNSEIIAAFN